MPRRQEEIAEFIRSSFPSIWSLELLLHLKKSPDAAQSEQNLIAALRASEAIAFSSIRALLAAGLIVEDDDNAVRYAPATADLARLTDEAEDLYRKQPNKVRRIIVMGSDNLAAFAAAFKFRKD